MWINEGFTVFLERKAIKFILGVDYYLIEAYNGQNDLQNAYKQFGMSNYSSLHPFTEGKNPDDSFSVVPYEKGF